MFYSRKTGRMVKSPEKGEKLSTAELAAYLSSQSVSTAPQFCPLCKNTKDPKYTFCRACFQKGKAFRREKAFEVGRERHLKLKREAAKLPARNRKKAKIVEEILRNRAIEANKPDPIKKTILYKSIESILLLKKLEDF